MSYAAGQKIPISIPNVAMPNPFRRFGAGHTGKTQYPISPLDLGKPKDGTPLQKHNWHTCIVFLWIVCLVSYFVAIEQAIRAHELLPDTNNNGPKSYSFGRRGTKRRETTVQAFNVGRTILTVAHVPIITAAIATTLPVLTQKTKERKYPPKISADQLFLLADRTWAGAGGWYKAIRIGNLSWEWWRLTLLVLVSFAGFPIATLGYLTVAEQYWDPADMYLPKSLRFNDSLENVRNVATERLDDWVHKFPQRELGGVKRKTIQLDISDYTGKSLFSFYPPANRAMERLGHFVTYLEPIDAVPRLLVADSMGMVQNIDCRPLKAGEQATLIDMEKDAWSCRGDCSLKDPRVCHSQLTLGKEEAQVASCVRPTGGPQNANPVLWTHAVRVDLEIALRITTKGSDPPGDAFASSPSSYTQAIQCSVSLIPGDGIIDSVIRRFMHFLPYGIGLATDTPEVLEMLKDSLPEMLNVTIHPAISLLHQYFSTSNHGLEPTRFNDSLPIWFGIHAPSSKNPSPNAHNSENGAYATDDTQKITPDVFVNAFTALTNGTFITALPFFVEKARKPGFSYQTDVKLERGFIPVAIAPLVLLMPVLVVAWMGMKKRSVPTWTESLDSFAMFRLGRHWEKEMEGCGAEELRDCWSVKRIPGWVGDAGIGEKEHEGVIKLGGRGGLVEGMLYE